MRKIITITCSLILFSLFSTNAQGNIPLLNGDFEDQVELSKNKIGTKCTLKGFDIFINKSSTNMFDFSNSGLAANKGIDESQALKAVIQNTTGQVGKVFITSSPIEIGKSGIGTYTFTFFVKAANMPKSKRPFWILVKGFDQENNVTTITSIPGGGTQNIEGITTDFVKQSITVDIDSKNIKRINLHVLLAKEDNTYLFDNFSLIKS